MKEKFKDKIIAEMQKTNFFETLPAEIDNFKLKKIFAEDTDKFIYFSYENEKMHRELTAYFHEETLEYKIRVKVGLNEFCLTKFFTENFSDYCKMLSSELDETVKNLIENREKLNPLFEEKKIAQWAYGEKLPANIADFELFINPKNSVQVTNGSYIIINYSDFSTASDFTLCYNIYTDKFSGEFTINHIPHVSYLFDCDNLKDLEKKLQENLSSELLKISNNLHGRK